MVGENVGEWFPYGLGNWYTKSKFNTDAEHARLFRERDKHDELMYYPEAYPFIEIP